MSDLDSAIAWLKSSPMQRMSLGSRELFHSNFLSWLFLAYPGALEAVFGLKLSQCTIEREKMNLDLIVRETKAASPVLIVENKVKSYPDKGQIERYNAKFIETDRRVLLTLVPPGFDPSSLSKPWETLLYKDLAICLDSWFAGADVEQSHLQYIKDYVTLIRCLSRVAAAHFDRDKIREGGYWFDGGWGQELAYIGFAQTLQKFKAVAFRDFMREAVASSFSEDTSTPTFFVPVDDSEPSGDRVKLWSALFNNTPCVTFEPMLANPAAGGLRFEIQIQGHQYRRLVAGDPLNDVVGAKADASIRNDNIWKCLEETGGDAWLFGRALERGFDNKKRFSLDNSLKQTSMRGDLCSYKPNVVYQYLNITVDGAGGTLSVDKLPYQISRDIELAFKLLKRPIETYNRV